jgi:hypothetical protein
MDASFLPDPLLEERGVLGVEGILFKFEKSKPQTGAIFK